MDKLESSNTIQLLPWKHLRQILLFSRKRGMFPAVPQACTICSGEGSASAMEMRKLRR